MCNCLAFPLVCLLFGSSCGSLSRNSQATTGNWLSIDTFHLLPFPPSNDSAQIEHENGSSRKDWSNKRKTQVKSIFVLKWVNLCLNLRDQTASAVALGSLWKCSLTAVRSTCTTVAYVNKNSILRLLSKHLPQILRKHMSLYFAISKLWSYHNSWDIVLITDDQHFRRLYSFQGSSKWYLKAAIKCAYFYRYFII